jgi:hypothetical protein
MTDHVLRLYALAIAVLVFFVLWAAIAARPWTASRQSNPQARALAAYEQRLRADTALLARLAARKTGSAPGPAVRVVTLPPLATTRTS